MALEQKVVQKQTQTLAISPQLRQAIELLELSYLDLHAYIEAQTLENPFLEVEQSSSATNEDDGPEALRHDRDHEGRQESAQGHSSAEDENYQEASQFWIQDQAPRLQENEDYDHKSRMEAIADRPLTLREHLLSQANTDIKDETERLIAAQLIDELHETGYFTTPLCEIADRLGLAEDAILSVLLKLQGFDPPGVFARSLRECLELQLKDRALLTPKIAKVLEYVDLYAEAKINQLLNLTGMTPETLKETIDLFKSLNPKPGLLFQSNPLGTLVPDVYVERSTQGIVGDLSYNLTQAPLQERNRQGGDVRRHQEEEGTSSTMDDARGWQVRLNPETLPRVLVNHDYKIQQAGALKKDKALRQYYQERMSAANWLVRALDLRAQNTLKVVESLVLLQQKFFEQGVKGLHPLTLRQVAEETGLHESTVSRITQNKYLSCPRGIFELRYFFNASITNAWTGEDQSALKIQHAIKEFVESENPEKPLSDDALVRKLTEKNLDIARRTVAKYRELMKIASSYERKKAHKRSLSMPPVKSLMG